MNLEYTTFNIKKFRTATLFNFYYICNYVNEFVSGQIEVSEPHIKTKRIDKKKLKNLMIHAP